MKKRILFLFVVIIGMVLAANLFGQTPPVEPTPVTGDYGNISSGNSSDAAIWRTWDGSGFNTNPGTVPTNAIGCFITTGTSVDVNGILNFKKYLVIQTGATLTMTSTGTNYANKVYAAATGTPKQATIYINGECGTLTNPVNMSWANSSSTYYVTGTSTSTPYIVFLRGSSTAQTVVIDKDIILVGGVPSIYSSKADFVCTINSGKTVTANSIISAGGGNTADGTATDVANTFNFTLNINGTLTIADGKNLNLTNLSGLTSTLNIGSGGIINLGGSLLAPSAGAGTVILAVTSGGTVNFNGTGASTLDVTKVSSPALSNLTINNAAGVTLGGSIGVAGTLTMASGNLALNGNTLTLGTSTSAIGTLAYSAGFLIGSGSFTRYINTSAITMGTAAGQFPFGISTNNRSVWIAGTPTVGGTITVQYADASGTTPISFNENSSDFVNRSNANWTIATGGGLMYSLGATLRIAGGGLPGVNAIADLNISGVSGAAGGSFSATTGTVSVPEVNRIIAGEFQLNSTFYFASTSSSPLPVEMTSFTASMQGASSAVLRWSTATEVNNNGFEVERRAVKSEQLTMNSWEKIGFVSGSGTSNSPKEYTFQDVNLAPGVYVYRIKQIDNDGTFKYSASTQVDAGVAKGFELLSNYPNPFNPETNIRFSVPENGFATLKVFNMLGQEVATLFSGMAQAGHYIPATFNAGKLASGVYFSRLEYNGKSLVQRMLMTK